MLRYTLQRLGLLCLILLGVLLVTFVLSRLLPGSPVEMMLGARPTPEQIEAKKQELGLDQPIPVQFGRYLGDIAQGDFGQSLRTKRPVLEDVGQRLPATIELVGLALLLASMTGVPLGVLAAVRQNSGWDHGVRMVAVAGMAAPVFFVGLLLQVLFAGQLQLLPLQGRIGAEVLIDHPFDAVTGLYLIDTLLAGEIVAFASALQHLLLPALTLALASLATVTRVTRNLMIESLGSDHVRTVLAYGLPARTVYFVYALKATLIPLLTILGLTFGFMLGGSIIVEYVFDWPGVGGYVVNGLRENDFPAVTGVTLFLAAIYLTINLGIDLLYHVLDPRLRVA